VLKDLIPQMEHPFYSLSKKPDTQIRRYEHNGNWLEIVPSVKGLLQPVPFRSCRHER
jgi:Replication initiator protein A